MSDLPNERGLRELGRQIDADGGPRHGRRGKGRHRRAKRILLVCGVVVVLLVGAVAGYAWYLNSEVHRITVKGLTPSVVTGKDAGTENILMVGSTSRCALTKQTPSYGLCTEGVTGVNSDVIMILHLNPAVPSVSILSIPRDLFIPNARADGANKVDAALAEGPTQLVAAIEEDFAIPIQHYVELNFDTFAAVVTALGGITMEFPEPVFDAYSGLNVPTPGCHHLDGVQALQVVRARHLQYKSPTVTATTPHTWPQETESDLARIRRDHEFLRVLATEVSSRGLSDPLTDERLISAVAPQLTVDSGLSATQMVDLLLSFHSVSIDSSPQLTLPVSVSDFGSYTYEGGTYGDVEFPPEPEEQETIDQFLGVTDDTDTMAGGHLPSPGTVTVSVENGSGVYGQAGETATSLGNLGFRIVGDGTTTPVGQEAETTVTYSSRSPGTVAAAELVARSLSGQVILAYGQTTNDAEVTVTTGTSFSVDATAPAPATTTTTGVGASSAHGKGNGATTTTATTPTTVPTGASSSAGVPTATGAPSTSTTAFTPPTPANQALSPWDPRACPAGANGSK
ncbi:MAG TPA: LCP family protein [Acidimicrobiales bacterium]|nr:LCP family protein [Acidimicrobiales bacterium]